MKEKRILAWILTFVMILSVMMTSPVLSLNVQAASKKYVKSLSVKKSVSVSVGEKITVKPIVKVVKKASTKVKVKVKNKNIAKVSYSSKTKKITIQGKKIGNTKVTVSTVAKNKKGKSLKKTIKVNVTKKKEAPVTPTPAPTPQPVPTPEKVMVSSISLTQTSISMLKGEKSGLTAAILPDNATDKTINWSCTPTGIISLTVNGSSVDIQSVKAGTATITAVAADGSNVTASCTVEVKDSVTVSSQEALDKALAADVGKIILNAAEGASYTISGSHGNTELEINGTGATIENSGIFSDITVNGGTYTENASGNTLLITAPSTVTISETAAVDEITVNISEGTKENEADKVTIFNNASLNKLDIISGGLVEVTGTAKGVIATNISGENVKLTTNQNMSLSLTAKAELVFRTAGSAEEGGTTQTTIIADTPENTPDIFGVGLYEVTYTDGSESKQIMAEASADIAPLEDLYGTVVDAFATEDANGDAGYEVSTEPLEGVSVYLIPAKEYADVTVDEAALTITSSAENSGIVKKETGSDGTYSFGETASGNYYMVMLKDGYKKAVQFLPVSSDYKTEWDNEAMELLDSEKAANIAGSITGTVVDAANKNGIAGLTVELRQNKGITVGDTLLSTTTGADGTYSLKSEEGLAADQYTIRVVDNRGETESRYITKAANVCVKSNNPTQKNLITSASIGGEGIRFVLSWGTEESGAPEDLDSHLYGPRLTGSGMFEVYYGAEEYGIDDKAYAQLDVDDTDWEGPETITINQPVPGTYYYYVRNYSESPEFNVSGAKVDIYAGDQLLITYNVPVVADSTADWWKVCSYNTVTKKITPYNVLESDTPFDEEAIKQGYEEYITGVTSTVEEYLEEVSIGNSSIFVSGNVPWKTLKDTLNYITMSGYVAEFTEDSSGSSTEVGTVTVSKNGENVKEYEVYYDNTESIVKSITCSNEADLLSYSIDSYDSEISIIGAKDWNSIKNTLAFKVGAGYTTSYADSEDYTARLDVLYGDEVVRSYYITYNKQVKISLENMQQYGITEMNCYYNSLEISLYMTTVPDTEEKKKDFLNNLPFTFSETGYTCTYNDTNDTLVVSNGTESIEYSIYLYGGFYITDVSYSSLDSWYEGSLYLDIVYDSDDQPEEAPVVTCVNGYTAVINGDILEIKDEDGETVVTKDLGIYSVDDY